MWPSNKKALIYQTLRRIIQNPLLTPENPSNDSPIANATNKNTRMHRVVGYPNSIT